MSSEKSSSALVERKTDALSLAGEAISTPTQLAERIRALQGQAHILSPMAAVAAIAPGYVVNPVVVVIDASVDAKSGRGREIYFQSAIHKSRRNDSSGEWEPTEASLNKLGLLKLLTAAGVNMYPTERIDDGREPHLWIMRSQGDIIDFDGRIRRLPAGTASVDLRDGSADIGEWTPERWRESVALCEQRKEKTRDASDRAKCQPEPINGWTHKRVLEARKFGYRLAEAKSLNALARNLGVRQVYTIAELAKPFVILRPTFQPDMSDPEVRRMVTAANLGARDFLYPGAGPAQVPLSEATAVTHGHGDPAATVAGEVTESEEPERMTTAAAPADAEEARFDEPMPPGFSEQTYHVTKVRRRGRGATAEYFVDTREQITLYTTDEAMARFCAAAAKDGEPRAIETERVLVDKQPYRQIIEASAPGAPRLL